MFFTVLIRLASGSSPGDTHFKGFTDMFGPHTHTHTKAPHAQTHNTGSD